jgi:hypothetical protein
LKALQSEMLRLTPLQKLVMAESTVEGVAAGAGLHQIGHTRISGWRSSELSEPRDKAAQLLDLHGIKSSVLVRSILDGTEMDATASGWSNGCEIRGTSNSDFGSWPGRKQQQCLVKQLVDVPRAHRGHVPNQFHHWEQRP